MCSPSFFRQARQASALSRLSPGASSTPDAHHEEIGKLVKQECLQAVTVGADGAINLVDLKDWACRQFRPASSSRSYYDVAWASCHAFVTTGTTGDSAGQQVQFHIKPASQRHLCIALYAILHSFRKQISSQRIACMNIHMLHMKQSFLAGLALMCLTCLYHQEDVSRSAAWYVSERALLHCRLEATMHAGRPLPAVQGNLMTSGWFLSPSRSLQQGVQRYVHEQGTTSACN